MNREFLKELGLEDDAIEKVMAEHGKAIQAVKPADDYEDLQNSKVTLEKQVAALEEQIEENKDVLNSVEDLKKEAETYKIANLKTTIANKAGIPLELASKLSGETEEELMADAESLAGFVNKKQTLPLRTTEPPKVDEKDKAYASLVDNLK